MEIEIKTKHLTMQFGRKAEAEAKAEVPLKTVKLPTKEYTYAPLRTALLPSPSELRQAIISVDTDARAMLDIIRKLAIADMHLLGIMETRRDALLGYDWDVEAKAKAEAEVPDEEKRKCDEIKNRLAKTNFTDLLKGVMTGRIYGHSVTVPHWVLDYNNQYKPEFENLDFVHFTKKDGKLKLMVDKNDTSFNSTIGTNYALIGNVQPNQYSTSQAGINASGLNYYDLNENELIIMLANPFEGLIKNYVGGLMRPALYLTLLKHYNILDWAKFNELYGMPLRVGKFDPLLSSDDAIAILKTAVKNMGTDAAAVIDKTTELELVEAGKITGTNTYNDYGTYVESKQSILILGQTLTTEITAKFGSRALGDTHNLVRMDKLWADIIAVQPIITKQVIERDYFYNYGLPPNGIYPEFKIKTDEYKDLQMMSGVVSSLSNAGLSFSKEWAHEYFGTKAPEEEEDSFGGKNPIGLL